MSKFVITTALALVLAGGAYAADHHCGGGGGGGGGFARGGGGGGGGGPSMMSHGSGPSNFSSMSRGPSGPSNFSNTSRGPSGRSNFAQGPQGRTLYNQEHGNRDIGRHLYNRQGDVERGKFDRDNRIGRDIDRDHGADFRHRGIVRGDFFEHGRRFHFRRFWHGEWVFLSGWDDCTAWAWIHVAPGVWAWRPIDVCIG
jgi:hypothetical protein